MAPQQYIRRCCDDSLKSECVVVRVGTSRILPLDASSSLFRAQKNLKVPSWPRRESKVLARYNWAALPCTRVSNLYACSHPRRGVYTYGAGG